MTWSLEEGSEPPDTSDTGPVGNHIINLQSCANYHPHRHLTGDDITRSSSGLNEDRVLCSPCRQPGRPQTGFQHPARTRTRDIQTAAYRHQQSQQRYGCRVQRPEKLGNVPGTPKRAPPPPIRNQSDGRSRVRKARIN